MNDLTPEQLKRHEEDYKKLKDFLAESEEIRTSKPDKELIFANTEWAQL